MKIKRAREHEMGSFSQEKKKTFFFRSSPRNLWIQISAEQLILIIRKMGCPLNFTALFFPFNERG